MKNKLYFLIFSLCSVGIIILLFSNIDVFGQDNQNTVKDIDGNVYKIVRIGTQVWMAENLKTTRYSNGDLIETTNLDEDTPKYHWAYADNESNVEIYGRLYTWYAASDKRNICPTGWHLPTMDQWLTLNGYLFGSDVAGGLLKERGNEHWKENNVGANNCSGFTALPGGYRFIGVFGPLYEHLGFRAYWWTSTLNNLGGASHIILYSNSTMLEWRSSSATNRGLSIRCLRDN